MKLSLVYDNESAKQGLRADWGFACVVDAHNTPNILFDTGASGSILLGNMKRLNIDPTSIAEVVISHDHWDHTGGLSDFLQENPHAKIYLPTSCSKHYSAREVIKVDQAIQLHENVYSTGELGSIEQSLLVQTNKGVVVVVGCSHSGVDNILDAAQKLGHVHALIGGLHGFNQFHLMKNVDLVCACHCTRHGEEIHSLYPEKWIEGGVGREIFI